MQKPAEPKKPPDKAYLAMNAVAKGLWFRIFGH
jgi:hypothetical protein